MRNASPAGRLKSADSLSWFFIAVIIAISIFYPHTESIAQTEIKLKGRVIDMVSGAPVPGATVGIVGFGRSATSDGNGRFFFTDLPPGEYYVKASRIGYRQNEEIKAIVDDPYSVEVIIRMAPSPVIVDGQSVIGTSSDILRINRNGAVTVVDFPSSGLGSVALLVDKLPELELVESGNGKYLRIRGAALNGTVVMLNGRPVNSTLDSRADISVIPFESVTSVEIITGGNYRTPGLAGTVNFITDMDKKNTVFAVERGSFGYESYAASGGLSLGNMVLASLDAHGEFGKGDFEFTDPRDSVQVRVNNINQSTRLFGGTTIKRAGASIKLNVRYFKRSAGVPGAVFQLTPEALSDGEEIELTSGFERRLFKNAVLDITAGMNRRKITFDSPRTPTNFIPYSTRFDELARDIKIGFNTTGRVDTDGYYSVRYESLDGNDLIRPSSSFGFHSRIINAISLGMSYRFLMDGFTINESAATIGVREEWGVGGGFLSPSLSLRFNSGLPLKPGLDLSYSRSRRLPDLTDLYWKEDVFATPNPDLNPEKSESFQIGADLKSDFAGSTDLRVTRYLNRYMDLVIWRKWAGDKFKPVNLSRAEIDGWELTFESVPFSGPLRIFWSASLINPLNKEEEASHHDKYLTFRPIGTQSYSIEFRHSRFELRLKGRHIGRRYTTEENTKSLPAVDLVDMKCRLKLNIPRVRSLIDIGVANLGDIQYEILDRQPEKPREYNIKITLSSKGAIQ